MPFEWTPLPVDKKGELEVRQRCDEKVQTYIHRRGIGSVRARIIKVASVTARRRKKDERRAFNESWGRERKRGERVALA